MSNYLKNTRCYLSGAIESAPDGANWREYPKQILTNKFGVHVFDPFADPKQQFAPVIKEAKKNKDIDTIVRIAKGFVRKDLSLVDHSEFLIAYLLHGVATVGTCHEIINSNNAKKPTLLVTNTDCITNIPAWYFGFIPKEFMFAGWEELFNYLNEVDDGKHRENNRWSYVYGDV